MNNTVKRLIETHIEEFEDPLSADFSPIIKAALRENVLDELLDTFREAGILVKAEIVEKEKTIYLIEKKKAPAEH